MFAQKHSNRFIYIWLFQRLNKLRSLLTLLQVVSAHPLLGPKFGVTLAWYWSVNVMWYYHWHSNVTQMFSLNPWPPITTKIHQIINLCRSVILGVHYCKVFNNLRTCCNQTNVPHALANIQIQCTLLFRNNNIIKKKKPNPPALNPMVLLYWVTHFMLLFSSFLVLHLFKEYLIIGIPMVLSHLLH